MSNADPYRTVTITLTAGEMDSLNVCFMGEKTWNQPQAVFTIGGRNRIMDKIEHLRPGIQYPGTKFFSVDVAYHQELLGRVLARIDKELLTTEGVRSNDADVLDVPVDHADSADRDHPDPAAVAVEGAVTDPSHGSDTVA